MNTPSNTSTAPILDPTFGPDETGITWLQYPDSASRFSLGMSVAPDNKILIAARSGMEFSLSRLNADGRQDDSFGNQGTVTGVFAAGLRSTGTNVRVLSDRNILLEGWFEFEEFAPQERGLALLDDKGVPVKSFGNGGVTVIQPLSTPQYRLSAEEIKRKGPAASSQRGNTIELPDGKLMVLSNHRYSYYDEVGVLMRLNKNGSLDTTFADGKGYILIQYLANATWASSLIVLKDGTFAVAGTAYIEDKTFAMMARFDTQGSPIKDFGINGYITFDFEGEFNVLTELIEMPDKSIIGVGSSHLALVFKSVLVCVDAQGKAVPTFNRGKPVFTTYPQAEGGIQWSGAVLRTGGRILTVGNPLREENSKIVLAQFKADGTLDAAFGNQGLLILDLTDHLDIAEAVAIQLNQIIVTGNALSPITVTRNFALRCSPLY
ncbi:hypothetical protein [Pseudomonas fluorescens]|uniref:hypothetical protein n=1 Tax=Pseudomonas fluorescens TaxID=294 RepID=UPI0007D04D0B|nr:hypothetical protein [Pseudomonas fluorescens]